MDDLKRCPRCKRELPRASFSIDRCAASGLVTYCKQCVRERRGSVKHYKKAYRDEHGKVCSRCDTYRLWTQFHKSSSSLDGHQAYCRPCGADIERKRDRYASTLAQLRAMEKLVRKPIGIKSCTKCGVAKHRREFYAHRNTADGRTPWCKECGREAGRTGNALNKDKIRDDNRRRRLWRYGLTPEQYDVLLEQQGGVCAICHQLDRSVDNPMLAIDHDHKTNRVRGLLCVNCNQGLGQFCDDKASLLRAVEYLEDPPAQRNTS